jgi:hypothetical protein
MSNFRLFFTVLICILIMAGIIVNYLNRVDDGYEYTTVFSVKELRYELKDCKEAKIEDKGGNVWVVRCKSGG